MIYERNGGLPGPMPIESLQPHLDWRSISSHTSSKIFLKYGWASRLKSNAVLCFLIFYLWRCLPCSKHCPPMSVSYDRHPMCFGQGCLMMQNEFYRDLDSGRTIMSLGFKKWCFLSIEAEHEEVDGKARLELKIIEYCWARLSPVKPIWEPPIFHIFSRVWSILGVFGCFFSPT